jgi:hypothetical protein
MKVATTHFSETHCLHSHMRIYFIVLRNEIGTSLFFNTSLLVNDIDFFNDSTVSRPKIILQIRGYQPLERSPLSHNKRRHYRLVSCKAIVKLVLKTKVLRN